LNAIRACAGGSVMRNLLDIKYTGFVGQDFIPSRNAEEGLRQAARMCDV
jgi:hypothetical protein